jgi:hypothetical protein
MVVDPLVGRNRPFRLAQPWDAGRSHATARGAAGDRPLVKVTDVRVLSAKPEPVGIVTHRVT